MRLTGKELNTSRWAGHTAITKIPGYRNWCNMHRRCYSPSATQYRHYGERGIRVCDEWLGPGGFKAFIAHIGPKPSRAHSIDRIDNDGNYEPGNVRWATQKEQCRNQRCNHILEFQGTRMTMVEWSEKLGFADGVLASRILTYGWDVERALTTPPGTGARLSRGSHRYNSRLTDEIVQSIRTRRANGESGAALAREYGVHPATICSIHLRQAWTHI